MVVHLALTNDIGLRAAVKAPTRRPDGTWNIKLTVAVFRPWRGSQATIASDPAFNAAPRFAPPHRRLGEEFDPAIAGCWQQGTANSPSSTTKTVAANRIRGCHLIQTTGADGPEILRGDLLRTCVYMFVAALLQLPKNWSRHRNPISETTYSEHAPQVRSCSTSRTQPSLKQCPIKWSRWSGSN